ncbi:MAG: type IV pilus assembly protein PilM [Gemmatimonadota bacterium]
MGLFGRSKLSAGLDIGSGVVKLVVIDHSKPEPEIVQVATSPLVPDAIVEGEVMDPVLVAETVRSIIESAGLKRKDVVAAVGGHDVIVKKIPMDRMSQSDAREVIRWEAEQHVPFDMENVQLDFQILDPDSDRPQMAVLLVAAKRELIENRISLLTDAGLNPAVIDVEAFALHNAFQHNYPDVREGMVALVNIGHETTNVNLISDGAPSLVRDVPFGTRRLREVLQRDRNLTGDQAEDVLQGRSDPGALRALLEERVDELAIGIERAAAFIVTQSGGEGIRRVFLSGGGAGIHGMVDAVAARMNVPAELANPLQRIGVRPEVMESVPMEQLASMLMLPVGLALRHA